MTDYEARSLAESLGWKASFCHMSGGHVFTREGVTPVRLRVEGLSSDRLARILKIALCRAVTPAEGVPTKPEKETKTMVSLYSRLAKVQSRGLHVGKSGSASIRGQRSYSYATLDDVLATVLPALAAEGLCMVQTVVPLPDGGQGLRTAVFDETGASIESVIALPDAGDWHAFGSGLTYSRRYGLAALLGVATDADDDAHAALPDRLPAATQRGNGEPVVAAKRDLPAASCPHCSGPMSVGPKGGEYCPDCWKAKRNGYSSMAAHS